MKSALVDQWSQEDSDNYSQDVTIDDLYELWYTRIQQAILADDSVAKQYALEMWRAQ